MRYFISTTSLWYWKKKSYNNVNSASVRNWSISQCKSNKKPMSPQYRVPTGKIFERLFDNAMYDFLSDNNLLSPNQSGFRSGDSCINQLFSINHKILNAFNKGLEVRGILLDISKAFDKVWHNGLIFKLRQNGICGDIIKILWDFFRNRKQRVVLNG